MDPASDATPNKALKPWIFGLCFGGIAGLFILVGGGLALSQAADLRRLVRADATVVRAATANGTTEADTTDDAEDPSSVRLRYRVGGQERLVPAPMGPDAIAFGDHGFDTHPGLRDGMTVPVWVDPAQPEAPRLSRAPDFFPYLFVLFPMIHLTIGLAVGLFAGQGAAPPAAKAKRLALLALAWNGVGGLCVAHYASLGGAFTAVSGGAFAAYGIIGVALVLVWWRFARLAAAAPSVPEDQPAAVLPDR